MQKFLCMFVCQLRLCGGPVDPLKLPSSGRGQSPNALEPFKHWLQVPFAPKVLKALGLGLVWAELSVQRGEIAYFVANREREGGGASILVSCMHNSLFRLHLFGKHFCTKHHFPLNLHKSGALWVMLLPLRPFNTWTRTAGDLTFNG